MKTRGCRPCDSPLFSCIFPDFFRNGPDQPELGPLFFFRQQVPFFCGGETALGTQAQLVQGNISFRFPDPGDDIFFFFQFRSLRGHQAQDYLLVFDVLQRFEAAGPVAVVFQEESVL